MTLIGVRGEGGGENGGQGATGGWIDGEVVGAAGLGLGGRYLEHTCRRGR